MMNFNDSTYEITGWDFLRMCPKPQFWCLGPYGQVAWKQFELKCETFYLCSWQIVFMLGM